MRKDERSVFFFDVAAESHHRNHAGLEPISHFRLLKSIEWLYKNDRAETTNRAKQAVYVSDMKIYDDRCEMLISFADTLAADPAFADRGKRKRRVVSKEGDEGLEHSAHVIWKFGKKDSNAPCSFLLEHATGLASSRVTRFINALLRVGGKVTPFELPDPAGTRAEDGAFKMIKVRPRIELAGHPSAEFIKDLKAGELLDVELFTHRKQGTPWDGNGHAIEDRSSVVLKPNPQKILPKAKAILDAVTPGAKKDFEFCRVRFKTASDVARTVSIHSDSYKLLNDGLYVRKERITELGEELPTAFDKLHMPIIVKMRTLL